MQNNNAPHHPTYETLLYEVENNILTLTLNREEAMNSFTVTMANELVHAFNHASENDQVKAIIVTGKGKAFCAGMDLSVPGNVFGLNETLSPTLDDMQNHLNNPTVHTGVRDTGGRVVLAMYTCKKPIIGAINGPAVGIGATMTLAMDVRIASTKARIGFVFSKIGITAEACSTWFLPRIVGISKALELVYSGDILNAEEALELKLVRHVAQPEDLMHDATHLAKKFSEHKSPVSIALMRQMIYRNSAAASPLAAHQVDSLSMFYTSIGDGKEGVRSFLEKRPPEFSAKASQMPPFYPWWEE